MGKCALLRPAVFLAHQKMMRDFNPQFILAQGKRRATSTRNSFSRKEER